MPAPGYGESLSRPAAAPATEPAGKGWRLEYRGPGEKHRGGVPTFHAFSNLVHLIPNFTGRLRGEKGSFGIMSLPFQQQQVSLTVEKFL